LPIAVCYSRGGSPPGTLSKNRCSIGLYDTLGSASTSCAKLSPHFHPLRQSYSFSVRRAAYYDCDLGLLPSCRGNRCHHNPGISGKSKSLVARTHDCRQLHRLSSVAFTRAGCAGSPDFLDRRPAPGSYHPCGCLCGQWDIDRIDEDGCRSPARGAGLVEVFRTLNDQSFPSEHVMSFVAFWGMVSSFGIIFFDSRCW
jgi:hypothetical protein